MKNQEIAKNVAYFCVILILVLVMMYSGLQILESTVFYQGDDPTVSSKTITRDGVDYFPRQDITVMMVLGIDQFGPVEDSGYYNNSGVADVVMLLIFDDANQECRILSLNRDTMLEMPVLGIGGKQAGTFYGQLGLSHTYGSGLEDSCENTRTTVSNFLYGIQIDYYISANMDAINIMNDAVGGVSVTVVDDFSEIDPSITMGEVTLRGEQAIHFVRSRKGVSDQLNLSRMERQKAYMDGFLDALRTSLEKSDAFALTVYEQISPYIVTDCSVNSLTGMMNRYVDYEVVEIVSPEGENVVTEEYYEFRVDEESLDELILRLFYAPKS